MQIKQFVDQLAAADLAQPGKIMLVKPIIEFPLDSTDFKAAKLMQYMLPGIIQSGAQITEILALLADISWWMTATSFGNSLNLSDEKMMQTLISVHGTPGLLVTKALLFSKSELVEEKTTMGEFYTIMAKVQWWFILYFSKSDGDI